MWETEKPEAQSAEFHVCFGRRIARILLKQRRNSKRREPTALSEAASGHALTLGSSGTEAQGRKKFILKKKEWILTFISSRSVVFSPSSPDVLS